MDTASKLFTFAFTCDCQSPIWIWPVNYLRSHSQLVQLPRLYSRTNHWMILPLCFTTHIDNASADVVMRRVYGALLVAMLVVCRVCAESGRV